MMIDLPIHKICGNLYRTNKPKGDNLTHAVSIFLKQKIRLPKITYLSSVLTSTETGDFACQAYYVYASHMQSKMKHQEEFQHRVREKASSPG